MGDPMYWHCFLCNDRRWSSTSSSIIHHVCAKHDFVTEEVIEGQHYGSKEDRVLFLRQRDQDIEDAARGFCKWLDSIDGADDFLVDVTGE